MRSSEVPFLFQRSHYFISLNASNKSSFSGPGAKVAERIKQQFGLNNDSEVRKLRKSLKKYRMQEERRLLKSRINVLKSEHCVVQGKGKTIGKLSECKNKNKQSGKLPNPFIQPLVQKPSSKHTPNAGLGIRLDIASDVYSGASILRDEDPSRRKIATLEFIGSYMHTDSLPSLRLPEICLVGRSNVGKSTFINTLMGYIKNKSRRCDMAYVSKTPGYTKSINIFKATDAKGIGILSLVDLPGYGFVKIKDKDTIKNMQGILRAYIKRRNELKLILFLVDGSIEPQDMDYEISEALKSMNRQHLLICTKMDKLSISKIPGQILAFKQFFNNPLPIPCSKSSGANLGTVWRLIFDACNDNFDLSKLEITDKFGDITPDYSTFVKAQSTISMKDLKKLVLKNYDVLPESAKTVDISTLDRQELLDLLKLAVERSHAILKRPPDLIELKKKLTK
ncbi:hypothetical protein BEWA_009880 [Theileria equi strain WA]|uniref:EngB-type G domain-containing protein n=1 Tax=Theileria equi strain WA TaxID=1537102 RepID=L0B379_THEEQ|nr:hypothetical protein BEWA_009880 [Theileria equi strain WA]AFZ81574.1 hypothetical protein BEWA_009880 [Theileria equi strain WA]|eukprot:XP_004831240.1 hypothetical protein BEWA_009880 [Theileria equi strain WA]